MEVLSRYGSYLLIGLGWLLFSVIIPSAAGPSDAAPRERLRAPVVSSGGAAPLLIGSPRQAPLPAEAGSGRDLIMAPERDLFR